MFWMLFSSALAQEATGFIEVRGSASLGVDGVPWQLTERFRPTFEAPLGEKLLLSTTAEVGISQGRHLPSEIQRTLAESDLGPILDTLACSWPENANNALHIDDFSDVAAVDRLYLDAYLNWIDIRVGRQAVQWGSALLINPTDPFPQVLFSEPWRPRAGQNAIRATVPIQDHRVQLFAGIDDTLKHERLALRATAYALQTDWSVVSAWRGETNTGLIGADLRGTLGVGWWVEGAWHLREQPYEELAVGIDYSFPVLQRLVIAGQYYRNGGNDLDGTGLERLGSALTFPECDVLPAGLDFEELIAEPDPYAPFVSKQNYLLLSAMVGFTEDVSSTVVALQNLDDGSAFLVPTVQVTPTGWSSVSLAAQIPVRTWGDGGEFKPSDDDLTLAFPADPALTVFEVDGTGLVPDATVILWTRASF